MDVRTPVHSRHSQYNNKRLPKSGPSPTARFMEKPALLVSLPKPKLSKSTSSALNSPSLLTPRPIATNSRVKQDEKYRKDMYLAFVSNALELKLSVRAPRVSIRLGCNLNWTICAYRGTVMLSMN